MISLEKGRVYANHTASFHGRANYATTQSYVNSSNIRHAAPNYALNCLLLSTCVVLYENARLVAGDGLHCLHQSPCLSTIGAQTTFLAALIVHLSLEVTRLLRVVTSAPLHPPSMPDAVKRMNTCFRSPRRIPTRLKRA
jgi:hypothetical protein